MTGDARFRAAQSPAEGYIRFRDGLGNHRYCRDGDDSDQRHGLSEDSIQATELLIEALRRRHNPRSDLLANILAGARDECQRGTQPLSLLLSPPGAPGHTDTPD